jgi:hypothetical protein
MTPHPVHRRKKLIEVAIPLEAINAASAREKSIRHGHPSTLHLWWARRPLAAVPEEFPTEEAQEHERLRLFALISELVTWENTTNEEVGVTWTPKNDPALIKASLSPPYPLRAGQAGRQKKHAPATAW